MKHEDVIASLRFALQQLDDLIEAARDEGAVALLDAVEMQRLLRAIVDGAPEHTPDLDRAMKRMGRVRSDPFVRITMHAIGVAWSTAAREQGCGAPAEQQEGDER